MTALRHTHDAEAPLDPGTKLGNFVIERHLGAGGQADVYVARDSGLGRHVAIKVLRASKLATTEQLIREAQIAANLDHPNIVRIYHIELSQRVPFIAMEFIDGISLDERIAADGVLTLTAAARCGIAAADALAHAHRSGVLHRDVKPRNILVSKQSVLKLVDFGLASSFSARDTRVGTVGFMAPEVRAGQPVTVQSDLYSLGATLYCALTGMPPSQRKSNHMLALPRATPAVMFDVIAQCLATEARERPVSADEVMYELSRAIPALPRNFSVALAQPPLVNIDEVLDGVELVRRRLEHQLRSPGVVITQGQRGAAAVLNIAPLRISAGTSDDELLAMLSAASTSHSGPRPKVLLVAAIEPGRAASWSMPRVAQWAQANSAIVVFDGETVYDDGRSALRIEVPALDDFERRDFVEVQLAEFGELFWTQDAVTLIAHGRHDLWAVRELSLAAICVSIAAKMAMVTTYSVVAAGAHDALPQQPEDVEAPWRRAPQAWPSRGLLATLRQIRQSRGSSPPDVVNATEKLDSIHPEPQHGAQRQSH
jgi:serine/threonine protein kinase